MFVFVKEHFLSFPQGSGNNKSKKSLKPPPKEVVNCFGSLTYVQNLIQRFLRNIHTVLNHHRRKIYQPYLQDEPPSKNNFNYADHTEGVKRVVCSYVYILGFLKNTKRRNKQVSLTIIQQPATQMTSIFEGQPLKNNTFSNQKKGHLGSRKLFKKTCSNKNNGEGSHIKNFALPSNSRDYQPSGFTGQNIPYGGSVFPAKLSRKPGICAWPRCLKKVKKYYPKTVVNDGDESYDTIQFKKSEKKQIQETTPQKIDGFRNVEVLLTSKKNKKPPESPQLSWWTFNWANELRNFRKKAWLF